MASSSLTICSRSAVLNGVALGRTGVGRRVEAGLEQLDEPGRQAAVAGQRVLDVLLAEGEADLAQVLGVGADHRHVASVEPGDDDQAVEPVALDGAAHEADERLDHVGRAAVVEHASSGGSHADVVEVHPLVADAERVGLLVEGDEAEVVEQRQQLGQRHRRAPPVHAHPPLAGWRVEVVAEGDDDVARRRSSTSSRRRRSATARSGVTAARYAAGADRPKRVEQPVPAPLAELADQGGAQAFGPRDRLFVDGPLEGVEVGVAVGDGRRTLTVTRASELADTNDSNVADVGAVGGGDDVGEALGKLGGEPAAREVHEHGRPQPGRLGHLEHPHHAAFLQPDDLADEVGDLGRRQFEDDVAREVLEDGSGGPARVAVHGLADQARARRRSGRRTRGCRARWPVAQPSRAGRRSGAGRRVGPGR